MKFLGILIFLCFAMSAQAGQYGRFSDLSKKNRELWSQQAKATHPLQFKPGLKCSAIRVGPNGEALTNLHCIEDCLVANHAIKATNLPHLNLQKINIQSALLPITCQAQMESHPNSPLINIEVLHIFGPGWLSPRENVNTLMNSSPSDYLLLVNEGYEGYGDLALIRIPGQDSTCVQIEKTDFSSQPPIDVVSLSYPIFYRKLDNNPMGETILTLGFTLMFSQGQISNNSDVILNYLNPTLAANVDLILFPGVLMSSTDSEGGASGSPLFNSNGKLIAVTRSTWKGETMEYIPWTTGAIDLTPYADGIKNKVINSQSCF